MENIRADGPYKPYDAMPPNYISFKGNDRIQYPWVLKYRDLCNDELRENGMNTPWQITSNVCGLKDNPLKNITLKNIHLKLDGGVSEYKKEVPEVAPEYPEAYVYGTILPAKGIYFRYVDNLVLDDVTVTTYRPDKREDFVMEHITN